MARNQPTRARPCLYATDRAKDTEDEPCITKTAVGPAIPGSRGAREGLSVSSPLLKTPVIYGKIGNIGTNELSLHNCHNCH
jgi:hypothetical protein